MDQHSLELMQQLHKVMRHQDCFYMSAFQQMVSIHTQSHLQPPSPQFRQQKEGWRKAKRVWTSCVFPLLGNYSGSSTKQHLLLSHWSGLSHMANLSVHEARRRVFIWSQCHFECSKIPLLRRNGNNGKGYRGGSYICSHQGKEAERQQSSNKME